MEPVKYTFGIAVAIAFGYTIYVTFIDSEHDANDKHDKSDSESKSKSSTEFNRRSNSRALTYSERWSIIDSINNALCWAIPEPKPRPISDSVIRDFEDTFKPPKLYAKLYAERIALTESYRWTNWFSINFPKSNAESNAHRRSESESNDFTFVEPDLIAKLSMHEAERDNGWRIGRMLKKLSRPVSTNVSKYRRPNNGVREAVTKD
jgi:hypothetical protein